MKGGGGKGGGKMKKGKGGKMKKIVGKMVMKIAKKVVVGMGKKALMMLGKMMMFKAMMMVPIAMKKSMIGGMAGFMTLGMMKLMMMRRMYDQLSNCGGGGGDGDCGGGGGGGGGGYDRADLAADKNYGTANDNIAYQPYAYYK